MKYDILVYGPIFCDLIFTDLPGMPTLGTEVFAGDLNMALGGSAIVAAGLNRLGLQVGLIADIGNDPLSQVIWQQLEEIGLDRTLIRKIPVPLQRVTVGLSFPQDRAFITRYQQPEEPIRLSEILHANRSRHLHICSFLAALETPNVLRAASESGMTVSFDPGWDQEALKDPHLLSLVAGLTIFMPSRKELCYLAMEDNLDHAALHLLRLMKGGMLVVKDGSNGASAFTDPEQEPVRVPSLPVNPVDTTGAGDAFDAGFLFAYLHGLPLTTCLKYGVICGGLSTTAPGGATVFPVLGEVEKWLLKLQ